MNNALSVDLEDWYHICGVESCSDRSKWDAYESRVVGDTGTILRLLQAYNVRATFFVLGYIAMKEPDLIKIIHDQGHEIATHGFYHRRVFEMTREEFAQDIDQSISVISAITKERVLGFRAPEWSVRKSTPWVFKILRKAGILYDSSMVALTGMGSRDFPRYPIKIDTGEGEIWEFPLSTIRLFHEHVPFSGGLPLRLTPYFYAASTIAKMNKAGIPAIVYMHPWEFGKDRPYIELPPSRRFMHYFNIESTPGKIEGLLRRFKFAPVLDVLGLSR
jgi:polysaccharide deacetylase family protein (PEP-CTERM system associated)